MNNNNRLARLRAALLVLSALVLSTPLQAFERTEEREPCRDHRPERQAFFGDVHVHTKYSLDASTQDTRTAPADAYRFAQGGVLGVQPYDEQGKAMRQLQLSRPLDFAMVSDHAELMGEVNICSTPGMDGYDSWACKVYRNFPRMAYYMFNSRASVFASRWGFCGDDGEICRQAASGPWREAQQAAEQAYDRSADCQFTSFVGYEWTGVAGRAANLHRNVLFRNNKVPELPISYLDGPSDRQLWDALDEQCRDGIEGCEVLTIPHNSNLSDGLMFWAVDEEGEALDAASAAQRARYEPLVEMMQHKGSSECYFKAGVTADELCAFEQLPYATFSGASGLGSKEPQPNAGFLRAVLNDGLKLEQSLGINPFQYGFIASTDTHISAPGGAEEKGYLGHGGAGKPTDGELPEGLPDHMEYNPGGLAGLWAEENSRDSLFAAMKRKEAFGTSGPHIKVRMFGGWDFDADICEQDFAKRADKQGVPMGSTLPAAPAEAAAPSMAVIAMQDPGAGELAGTPLQRLQVIKGWIDANGEAQQQVYDIAGDPNNGASVDLSNCEEQGDGFASLCQVWSDPDFDAEQSAWYYARAVENPSCRWSQRICLNAGVDCSEPDSVPEAFSACCSAEHRPVIQERAWGSPVWYRPNQSRPN